MSIGKSKSIAVIGAGIAGVLSALELADRGHKVVLFELADAPLTAASFVNEGKIHLGFVYAADPSGHTASTMLDGALVFRSILCRWVDTACFDSAVSEPFEYAVPRSSQVPPSLIENYFSRVTKLIGARLHSGAGDYLGLRDLPSFQPVEEHGLGSGSHEVLAAFSTPERAIDTHVIAAALRSAVQAHPRIDTRTGHRVSRCSRERAGWSVHTQYGVDGSYGAILNASWGDRRKVDEASGFQDREAWFLRYKVGAIFPDPIEDVRNLTFVLGSFGDIVRYNTGRVYLSWYPSMMIASTREKVLTVPAISNHQRVDLIRRGISEMAVLYPCLNRFANEVDLEAAALIGGHIVARGRTDINDETSRLHQRTEIGPIQYEENYVSLETGKYTTAPLFAVKSADAIAPANTLYKVSSL